MKDIMIDLPYFKAPLSHTLLYPGADPDPNICVCCEKEYEHTFYIEGSGKNEKYGCLDCLLKRKFSLWHSTGIGDVVNGKSKLTPPPEFSQQALIDICYSPPIATYQSYYYLSHCKDFMTYIGRWEPDDFNNNAIDNDGRSLWISAVNDTRADWLWDQTIKDMHEYGDEWPLYENSNWAEGAAVYVFKCRHCGKIECYWDCD
jgi:uncharacterized protein CbrC (UPF0167 family)